MAVLGEEAQQHVVPKPAFPTAPVAGELSRKITVTHYEAKVPSMDSLEHLLLTVLARLNDIENHCFSCLVDSTVTTCVVTKTVKNRFTLQETVVTATGWTGCARLLCLSDSEKWLLGHGDSGKEGSILSWMQATEQTVASILKQQLEQQQESKDKTDTVFGTAVADWLNHLEIYLFEKDQTYLVGDFISAADVVTCLGTAAVLQQLQTAVLPQQAHRWIMTVLGQLQTTLPYLQCAGWISFGLQTVNVWNTWMSTLTAGPDSPTAKAAPPTPAVVPAAAADATKTKAKPVEKKEKKAPAPVSSAPEAAPATAAVPAAVSTAAAGDATPETNAILKQLQDCGLLSECEVYSHTLCKTADELVANVPLPSEKESHTKNLFLRDKKHGLFLVTVRPAVNVNTKTLGQKLNLEGKTNLRLADEALLQERLRVSSGALGPLCAAIDTQKETAVDKEKIVVVMDQALLSDYEYLHSHPLRNDMSVKMKPATLQAYLSKAGIEAILLDFSDQLAGSGGSAPEKSGKAPANRPPASKTEPTGGAAAAAPKSKSASQGVKKSVEKGETLLALQWKKDENFPQWYSDIIVLSEMISYYDISGCYILRPWSYKIWELIQEWFNEKIYELGVENSYFPLFVSQDRLEKEKDHVEGFAPEVAWVTRSGSGDLAKPIAIRPTSETIMYPAYSDWIRSHRDLPLKLNQWSNVVRWEFKYPTPFLRTREFLWQEGHTAHSTFQEADEMVMAALDLYRRVYEELLAVPVVPGYKTEKEKFAGGFRTTTVEAYIAGSGRAIQGATSHNLGQNFGKMFDITFQNDKGVTEVAWQTSWGLTTRTIGVMVMVHGDDTGLVLPPRVAPLQVVIVPIISKQLSYEQAAPYCNAILADLKKSGLRARFDDRDSYNPGWKYNHWEQKGVPVRIEVGPRDVQNKAARIVIRHNGAKEDYPVEGLGALIKAKLEEIQQAMFEKAKAARDSHVVKVTEWKDFVPNLEKNNLVLTPWCGGEHKDWEEKVKEMSREESLKARGQEEEDEKTATSVAAKTLCIPFDQPELPAGTKCIASGMDATCWILWGRSY